MPPAPATGPWTNSPAARLASSRRMWSTAPPHIGPTRLPPRSRGIAARYPDTTFQIGFASTGRWRCTAVTSPDRTRGGAPVWNTDDTSCAARHTGGTATIRRTSLRGAATAREHATRPARLPSTTRRFADGRISGMWRAGRTEPVADRSDGARARRQRPAVDPNVQASTGRQRSVAHERRLSQTSAIVATLAGAR